MKLTRLFVALVFLSVFAPIVILGVITLAKVVPVEVIIFIGVMAGVTFLILGAAKILHNDWKGL